jgi:hypothetical protein
VSSRLSARRLQLNSLLASLLLYGASCAKPALAPPEYAPVVPGLPPLLTWLGEFTRPMGAMYPTLPDSTLFGSVSGLVRDGANAEWIAAIDEREGSRVAWLTIDAVEGKLAVTPTRLMSLRAGPRVDERRVTRADLEAITRLADGTFLMMEEGHIVKGEAWQPAMLQMTRDGIVTSVFTLPQRFQVHIDQARGVRDNQGFEGLTRLPDGHLILGLEQPLIEDGPMTSFDHGGSGLLIEMIPRGREWAVGREWRYQLDPTPHIDGFAAICSGGENGLVDLLAFSAVELFSMERACLQNPKTSETANSIRIFRVELSGNAARKTLLLDLNTLAGRLSPALEHLDNFEALSFGPPLVNGTKTLLIASDDNRRRTQKTSFLLFGLR